MSTCLATSPLDSLVKYAVAFATVLLTMMPATLAAWLTARLVRTNRCHAFVLLIVCNSTP
jgi:hypothetical protein